MTKKLLLMLLTLACASYVLQAAPCASDTLANYIAGPGCTIDGLFFDHFAYTNPSSGGGISPDATGVDVTPVTMGSEVGFTFTASWLAASGQTSDGNIAYSATCVTCMITDLELAMDGIGMGTGVASVAETSTSPVVALGTSSSLGFTKLTDSTTFSPVGSITLTKDIGASGGTAGVGHVSAVTNLFSTNTSVPEPSLFLLSLGFVALVPVARKKFGRQASV